MRKKGQGSLRKLVSAHVSPVNYTLQLGNTAIVLNELLGQKIKINFLNNIFCVHCGRKTNKSFSQGYCYPCFTRLAQCDTCIVKPEQCHHHLGTCREPAWGLEHCMIDHIVYLANSSGLKVGITRASQVPTRWIDQGAVQALPVLRVATRLQSGLIEVIFKNHVADKTHWQKMLKEKPQLIDMIEARDRLLSICQPQMDALSQSWSVNHIQVIKNVDPVMIDYPVLEYPTKISSFNLDKTPVVEGQLLGIKGQYIMLDSGVFNMRTYSGYEVEFYSA